MRYEIPVYTTISRGAVNKGIIPEVPPTREDSTLRWYAVEAASDQSAYNFVLASFKPSDNRTISGKSYLRNYRVTEKKRFEEGGILPINQIEQHFRYKVGDRVKLHKPYQGLFRGVVSEVVSPTIYSIDLEGYHNPYVDFSVREFATESLG